jgi:hypothetical protein
VPATEMAAILYGQPSLAPAFSQKFTIRWLLQRNDLA